MNLKGSMFSWSQMKVQCCTITLLNAFEGFQSIGVLCQSTESEVLKAHYTLVGNTCQIHRVVPNVKVILHPLIAIGSTRHDTGNTGRVILIRWQTIHLETFTGHLSTCILHTISSLRSPNVVLCVRIVTCNAYLTTLANGFLVPSNLYGSHHSLTGIAEATGRTMVEHIPLTIDQLQ